MPATDVISNLFNTLYENEKRNKKECMVMPVSKLAVNVLRVLQKYGYIGEFELIDDKVLPKVKVQLLGKINKCGSIKPRFPAKWSELSAWERKYLPAVGMGILIVSTDKGVMSHLEAMEKRIGGRLIGYVY